MLLRRLHGFHRRDNDDDDDNGDDDGDDDDDNDVDDDDDDDYTADDDVFGDCIANEVMTESFCHCPPCSDRIDCDHYQDDDDCDQSGLPCNVKSARTHPNT